MSEEQSKYFIVLNFQFDCRRHLLLGPLFKLLSKVFSEECVNDALSLEKGLNQPSSSPSEVNTTIICHIQQTLLIILEDIIMSLKSMAPLNVCFLIIRWNIDYLIGNFIVYHFAILAAYSYSVSPSSTGKNDKRN